MEKSERNLNVEALNDAVTFNRLFSATQQLLFVNQIIDFDRDSEALKFFREKDETRFIEFLVRKKQDAQRLMKTAVAMHSFAKAHAPEDSPLAEGFLVQYINKSDLVQVMTLARELSDWYNGDGQNVVGVL